MRLLIFGGSFDPPHLGHAALIKAAAAAVRPDRILVIPAYHAPLKDFPGASAEDRLVMVRSGLLPALPPRLRRIAQLDLGELRSRRRVYTVETLRRLQRLYPDAELHFAVGSDAAANFLAWKNPGRLQALCRWWAGGRHDNRRALPRFFKRLGAPMPDISSTAIRRRISLGEDAGSLLAPRVKAHIEARGLYGRGLLRVLGRMLKPERFEHSLAVARLAERLALRWNLNSAQARLAGLLHDCGRSILLSGMPSYARRRRLAVPDFSGILRYHPLLLHAYVSADIARRRFGVKDKAVLSAIAKHTLGARRMSPLDRLLYVADAASEDRAYPGVAALRRLAFEDLGQALRAAVGGKISQALAAGSWLHPVTVSLWNSLQD